MRVHIGRAINKAKQSEQFILVLFGNAHSRIFYRYLQVFIFVLGDNFNAYFYKTFLSKFYSVGLDAKEDLHQTVFIGLDKWALKMNSSITLAFGNVFEGRVEFQALLLCFFALDRHDPLNSLPHVELFRVSFELA
jgi:hypothetical protein